MGNNKKTVKCSFCNRLGHNRVSCQKLKLEMENSRLQYGDDHPDVKDYDDYKEQYSKKSKDNASRTRKCSYCLSTGHNMRTCKDRINDFSKLKRTNKKWRNNILKQLEDKGIGLGSIMVTNGYINSIENRKSPWTLVSIDWDNLSWLVDHRKVFKLILISNPSIFRVLTLEQLLNDSPSYHYRWKVVSTSSNLNYPENWNTVSDPVFDSHCVEIFKGLTKAEYDAFFFKTFQKSLILQHLIPNIGEEDEQ